MTSVPVVDVVETSLVVDPEVEGVEYPKETRRVRSPIKDVAKDRSFSLLLPTRVVEISIVLPVDFSKSKMSFDHIRKGWKDVLLV